MPTVPNRYRVLPVLLVLAALAAACRGDGGEQAGGITLTGPTSPLEGPSTTATVPGQSFAGTEPAPDFPDGLEWLNVDRPLSLGDLRGKVVLLDFWTYGCINCIHIIPDLERLEEEFPDELVVIGVHSAKFDNEAETENIRQVIVRYGLEHPVVNDSEFAVWRQWGAQAWPTLVLVDPAGNVVGGHSGEGVYPVFRPVIASLVAEFDERGEMDRAPIDLDLERDRVPDSILSYPGKILADPSGGRIFVADTNHHRIVVADPETGEVLDVAGAGRPGFLDGPFTTARFDQPQGMALSEDGSILYVADLGNHSIRTVDFTTRTVGLLVGTGRQSPVYPPDWGTAPDVALSSPWALERHGSRLFVAMAGSHQIWAVDLDSGFTSAVAGSGREGALDGPAPTAELAQPSGLAAAGGRLFFADAESSSIRYLDLEGEVTGLLAGSGAGLFDFGHTDGIGTEARFQHPLGLAFDGSDLLVADTYNSVIRRIDPGSGETTTFLGGEAGWRDGDDPRFFEPGGLDVQGRMLYIADTNNNVVRKVDLDTGSTETLVLFGIERFVIDEDGFPGVTVRLDPVTVAPGEGAVVLDVGIPDGYKVNDLAPFSMTWSVEGGVAELGDADQSIIAPEFPLRVPATFIVGEGLVTAELTVYYCTTEAEGLCLIEQTRLEAPIRVEPGAAHAAAISYDIPLPPTLR